MRYEERREKERRSKQIRSEETRNITNKRKGFSVEELEPGASGRLSSCSALSNLFCGMQSAVEILKSEINCNTQYENSRKFKQARDCYRQRLTGSNANKLGVADSWVLAANYLVTMDQAGGAQRQRERLS